MESNPYATAHKVKFNPLSHPLARVTGTTTTQSLVTTGSTFITADGTQSIYFLEGGYPMVTFPNANSNQIGCICDSTSQMYFDFNDTLNFRFYTYNNNTSGRSTSLIVDGLGVYVKPTTTSTTSANGSLVVSGGVGIVENANVGGTLKVNATTSTSTGTGALIVSGGIGIAGNINVGKTLAAQSLNVNAINVTYTTLPTFTSNQIGYIVSSYLAGGANTTGSLQNLTSVGVNAGVWLVKWNFTVSAVSGTAFLLHKVIGVGITSTTLLPDRYFKTTTEEVINTTNLTPTYQGTYFLTTANASSTIYLICYISPVIQTYNIYLSALRIA